MTSSPPDTPTRTTARRAAFIPGASPPLVSTAIRFIVEQYSPSTGEPRPSEGCGSPVDGEYCSTMKRIAVLTSGGDAPGMNAALRAVVRVGVSGGLEAIGVRQGYTGLIEGKLQPLGPRDVASIIHVGGTMLGSAWCAELRTPEGRQ